MKHYIFALYLAILALFGGCYESFTEPKEDTPLPQRTLSIAELKAICRDKYTPINQDAVCVGVVTSSDSEGNFYRSIFIEDETAALEILVGRYDTYALYPIGATVAIRLSGCAAELKGGTLQIGLPKRSYDLYLREFESQVLLDKHITCSSDTTPPTPLLCEVASLDTSLCGRLIRINNLRHTSLTEQECANITGYHRFTTSSGEEIYTYVSEYAKFATMAIPEGDIAIVGVLQYEYISGVGDQFALLPRFESDLLNGAQNLNE